MGQNTCSKKKKKKKSLNHTKFSTSCRVLLEISNFLRKILPLVNRQRSRWGWIACLFLYSSNIDNEESPTKINHCILYSPKSLEPQGGSFPCMFSSFSSCSFTPFPFCNLWYCRKVTEEVARAGCCRDGRFQMMDSQVGVKDCQECVGGSSLLCIQAGVHTCTLYLDNRFRHKIALI